MNEKLRCGMACTLFVGVLSGPTTIAGPPTEAPTFACAHSPQPAPAPPSGDSGALANLSLVATQDPNEQHRMAAVEQMIRVPADSKSVAAILEGVRKNDPSGWVRHAAGRSLNALRLVGASTTSSIENQAGVEGRSERPVTPYRAEVLALWEQKSHSAAATQAEMLNLDFFPDGTAAESFVAAPPIEPVQLAATVADSTFATTPPSVVHAEETTIWTPTEVGPPPMPTMPPPRRLEAAPPTPLAASTNPPTGPLTLRRAPIRQQTPVAMRISATTAEEETGVATDVPRFELENTPKDTAGRKLLAKRWLRLGRDFAVKQRIPEAEATLQRIYELAVDFGPFEYGPRHLQEDIERARTRLQGNSAPITLPLPAM